MKTVDVKPIVIDIPHLTPPSVNHYKIPVTLRTRNGPVQSYAKTPEAEAFQAAVAIFAGGRSVAPATDKEKKNIIYRVDVVIVLGKRTRLDIDNGLKVLLDGLELAGVIHSDARVGQLTVEMVWDQRDNPRTHITVSRAEE